MLRKNGCQPTCEDREASASTPAQPFDVSVPAMAWGRFAWVHSLSGFGGRQNEPSKPAALSCLLIF